MASLFSYAAVAGLFGIGAGAAFAPAALATNYGLPLDPGAAGPWLIRALGARDAALGVLLLVPAVRGDRAALRTALAATALVALADFAIVARARGRAARPNLAIHATGVAGLVLAAALE